jgi:hypothetical protein
MALSAGTVTITADATTGAAGYSGSGLALALAQAEVTARASQLPPVPTLGQTTDPYSAERPATQTDIDTAVLVTQALYDEIEVRAVAYAIATIAYFVANASIAAGTLVAHVTTQQLGRTPNPNTADTPIVAPSAPVDIPLTGAGTIS